MCIYRTDSNKNKGTWKPLTVCDAKYGFDLCWMLVSYMRQCQFLKFFTAPVNLLR